MMKVCCRRVVKVRNANNTHRRKPLVEMLEHSGGSSKSFGITKKELDFRYWLVCAIVPLSTSTREKKGDLVLLPFAACSREASEAFARAAVLHCNIYLLPLINGLK
jgi:hypothetical protein